MGKTKLLVYTLCGLCCGISAVLATPWLGVAQSTTGLGYELGVIAAAVIGGASLMGGYGSALRALQAERHAKRRAERRAGGLAQACRLGLDKRTTVLSGTHSNTRVAAICLARSSRGSLSAALSVGW